MHEKVNVQPHSALEAGSALPAMQGAALGVFLSLFFKPHAAFQVLNYRPRWVMPFFVIIIMGVLLQGVLINRIGLETMIRLSDPDIARKMESPQAAAAIHQWSESPAAMALSYITGFLGPVICVLLVAAVFTGTFILIDRQSHFKRILSVTAHAIAAYSLVYNTLQIVIVLVRDDFRGLDLQNIIMSNPVFLLNGTTSTPTLRSLVSSLDLFSVWLLFLWIVGFKAILPSTSTGRVTLAVIGLWVLYVIGKMAFAALAGT